MSHMHECLPVFIVKLKLRKKCSGFRFHILYKHANIELSQLRYKYISICTSYQPYVSSIVITWVNLMAATFRQTNRWLSRKKSKN